MPTPIETLLSVILKSEHLKEKDKTLINEKLAEEQSTDQDKVSQLRCILHGILVESDPASPSTKEIYSSITDLVREYPLNDRDKNEKLLCPITQDLLPDSSDEHLYSALSGYIFTREALEHWLQTHLTDPIINTQYSDYELLLLRPLPALQATEDEPYPATFASLPPVAAQVDETAPLLIRQHPVVDTRTHFSRRAFLISLVCVSSAMAGIITYAVGTSMLENDPDEKINPKFVPYIAGAIGLTLSVAFFQSIFLCYKRYEAMRDFGHHPVRTLLRSYNRANDEDRELDLEAARPTNTNRPI